ncbi:MAG: methylated-DNA--[protein]-cysteine S-methyltransferase [Chloroflexota bacterium]
MSSALYAATLAGPLGPVDVAWGPAGVVRIDPAGDAEAFAARVAGVGGVLPTRLRAVLAGADDPAPPADLAGLGAFARAVLAATARIPRGEVRPYAWAAAAAGRPAAVRAAGSALAGNPVPFLIPCHRIVRSDGRIGEYSAGGPEAKRSLLAAEGVDLARLAALAGAGLRVVGAAETATVCHPTCARVRALPPAALHGWATLMAARAAGREACPDCRPV